MTSSPRSFAEQRPAQARDGLRAARVAFTGRLASMTRREADAAVRRAGGVGVGSVTGRTTMLVVGLRGLPIRADGRVTRALERAEALRRAGVEIRILGEDDFLAMLRGGGEVAGGAQGGATKRYPLGEVASLVGVEPEMIERWEHLGLVRSGAGLYDFQDIVSLQSIASLVRSGASPGAIWRSLDGLSSVLPHVDRPLAQLKIVIASSGELLAQIGEALIDPQGQQHLDFERCAGGAGEDGPASIAEVKPAASAGVGGRGAGPEDPDELFERALAMEEDERYAEAAAWYRRAIGLSPGWAEAHFNLANVLRMLERDEGAEEVYHLAVELDPSNELAWYNLADVQEEDGRLEEAAESLGAALRACPTFSDAHFNLASCLEQLGDRAGARRHWSTYLRLDPDSAWAAIARDHLRGSKDAGPEGGDESGG